MYIKDYIVILWCTKRCLYHRVNDCYEELQKLTKSGRGGGRGTAFGFTPR